MEKEKDLNRILTVSEQSNLGLSKESAEKAWVRYSSIFGDTWITLPEADEQLATILELYLKTHLVTYRVEE